MDRIVLYDLRFYGHHGVYEQERAHGQWYRADVELVLDLKTAGVQDELESTVDYAAVAEAVLRIGSEERFALIEALAERIARHLLETYPRLDRVRVSIHKTPPAPLNVRLASWGSLGYAAFQVVRRRDELSISQNAEE